METKKAIQKRYSCRNYSDKKLTQEEIKTLIKAANAAPAASNDYTKIKLTIIEDKELIKIIEETAYNVYPQLTNHPLHGATALFLINVIPHEVMMEVSYANAAAMAENICIQATDLELASTFTMGIAGGIRQNPELLEKLNITKGFIPAISVLVGHAKEEIGDEKPERLKVVRF